MQASIHLSSSPFLSLPSSSTKTSIFSTTLLPVKHHLQSTRTSSSCISIKATSDVSQVDYSSMASSVFPAEACDTVGGDACNVEMFPETKFTQQPDPNVKVPAAAASQTVDREYLQYDSPKTVFIAEACDDLGGEFCEPSYQSGAN